jgi:hypothetical protein
MTEKRTMLVEGRECGACTACCHFIGIKSERLEKPTNVLCPHCILQGGCAVYDRRPPPCSGWYCGWRMLPILDEGWRPDLSGIVVRVAEGDTPDLTFTILDSSKLMFSEKFAGFVAAAVMDEVPVFFQTLGPLGHFPSLLQMNDILLECTTALDLSATFHQYRRALDGIAAQHVWESDGLELRTEL